jgi:hypothetical protein
MYLQQHTENNWIKPGMIVYYETEDLCTKKVIAGARNQNYLELPQVRAVTLNSLVYLKCRVKSRCYFCVAKICSVNHNTFTVELPSEYYSLPRLCFQRLKVSLWGCIDRCQCRVIDISSAGAAIEVQDFNLPSNTIYPFHMGRFKTLAQVNCVHNHKVHVQFAIRDNYNPRLLKLIQNTRRELSHLIVESA